MNSVTYGSPNKLTVGYRIPVKVNLSVGVERADSFNREYKKVRGILSLKNPPDLMMDLSSLLAKKELWEVMRAEFDGPIGVLPHYAIFNERGGLDEAELLERIENLFKSSVNFITIHCTPSHELFSLAKKDRAVPVTSRGGGIVLRDMSLNKRKVNIYELLFEDICKIAAQHGGVINLGTSFRAGSVADGFDRVAKEELVAQAKFCRMAKAYGAQVILEGPGHMPLHKLADYHKEIKAFEVPPMPLGPIVSDSDDDFDHVSSAIGAAEFMMIAKGGIINAITAVEHKGGVPSQQHLTEGLRVAKLAAQIASVTYSKEALQVEGDISKMRGVSESCILDSKKSGCSRCGHVCPLLSRNYL
ncbi:hypothetical protein CKO15_08520 [Halorhodospira abdelmalekii]|uniref:phosphomethylpyrimidine synthase ThiC n=1 Tax=Halorhodospira abdelmalekii TaxID=421629 RepID=UPI001907A6D4|nr:phosphomethylpyrimidine synthase ThiC [Halorhodospira abdelmalekii]MBK1735325.1 hypothetical protein [Halorhodospira abdelmalekii]